ncbi:sensor histidine kinase [Flagellimonas algicola]|uniref:Oxygen sensor histidine kinase NreB n=1 Tax=Flagellimonas algicola TaxID=2583815 RepID=A0ABY2WQ49_9FLAO|nr:sensor histidine kinase [Allomuricauda algicola]TMU56781.1 sensor histidine kinase [Allomuricauda algicola]
MKNKLLILLLVLLCACGKQATVVPVSKESEQINAWIDAARDSVQISIAARKGFLNQSADLAYGIANDTIRLDHLSRISLAYKRLEDSVGFRKMNHQVLELARRGKLYKAEGESHWDMASFLKSYGVMDSAFYHYQKAHKSFQQLPVDSTSLSLQGRILYSMGGIQDYFMDYLGAEKNVTEALRIFDGLEDNLRIYNCYNLLGVIAGNMKSPEKALESYQKAGVILKKLDKSDQVRLKGQNQHNIAYAYLKGKDYNQAELTFNEFFKDNGLKSDNPELYSTGLVSLAYSIFKGKSDFQETENLLLKAIAVNDSVGFSMDQARAKQYYAELLAIQGDTLKALKNANEGLEIATETSNNDHHLEILRLLTKLDSKNAVSYSNEYYSLNESIKSEERVTRDKFARIRLETDEVIQRNEALTRGKLIWTLVAIGLLLAAIALYIIFAQRASNNKLKFEQKQQDANKEIYNLMLSQRGKFEEGKKLEKKRVSEELHDSVLGDLLSIRMFMGVLNEQSDESAVEQRAQMIEKLREVEEEIRTISHEMNKASYEKFYNFIVSLEELVETIEASSGIQCSFTYDDDVEWDALDGDIKINSYRIVQESLKNSVKHAQCEEALIAFKLSDGTLTLTIQDNGVGFDVNKGRNGIGLRNLTSRAEKMNGTLHVDSGKGNGTTITVQMPAKYIGPQNPSGLEGQIEMQNA